MPNYEIALPPGAKNIRIKTSTQEIPVDWQFYRHGKDGAEVIVPLFGGDEFVGEVLEGNWKKGDDGSIQGPFTAKINNGYLELTGRSDSTIGRTGWVTSQSKIPLLDDLVIDVHLKLPPAPDNCTLNFYIRENSSGFPGNDSNSLFVRLHAEASTFSIRGVKKVNGTITIIFGDITVTNNEGTFRIKFEETKPGHNHTHFYYHDGVGEVDESTDEVSGSPFNLSLGIKSGYANYLLGISETTNRTVSSDFVHVTYPDFKVVYDLDDDAYQGEGEELLKKAWDTSGNGNHGMVHGATWVRDGKFGKALSFDGDDYVTLPDVPTLDITGDITIIAWVRPNVLTGYHIIARNGFSRSPFNLYQGESNLYFFYTVNGSWGGIKFNVFTETRWYCVACTREFVGDTATLRLFVDGCQIAETTRDGTPDNSDTYPALGFNTNNADWFNGIIDEVRIYNRALSEAEIQTLYNGGEVTDGLVGEWKFDGGNDRGEVKVYDTMGSDDESDWQRVYDVNHQFVGDCVVENGLVRVIINEGTSEGFKVYWWNGSAWELVDGFFAVQQISWNNYIAETPYLNKINSITADEASVRVEMWHSSYSTYVDVVLRRGDYNIKLILREKSANQVSPEWRSSDCTLGILSGDTGVPLASVMTGSTVGSEADNFSALFNTTDGRLLCIAQTTQEGNQQAYSNSVVYTEFMANRTWMTTLPQSIFLAVVPFSQVSNLFKEAEDATLLGGATVDTTQTDDSGDSVLLDAQNEAVYYSLTGETDLPIGRYIVFVRAKDTNHIENDLGITVYNQTDSRHISEDKNYKNFTLTSSFTYYGVVFSINDEDSGDTLQVRVYKARSDANNIYIDYFLIIPIGNGESWPQDLAHNALRTFTKHYKVYKR
ncbi:hypothetical protein DRN85_07570 [Methanosarcinales archaeon]|nr:MAG: hypothetical protein DRN85_07570 [Methanosarcinales archaeon]